MASLKSVYEHWHKEWVNDRKLFWLELIGTIGSVTGTVLLSIFVKHPPMFASYCFWLVGSSLLMLGAYRRHACWFFVLMLFNTVMNIVAFTQLVL